MNQVSVNFGRLARSQAKPQIAFGGFSESTMKRFKLIQDIEAGDLEAVRAAFNDRVSLPYLDGSSMSANPLTSAIESGKPEMLKLVRRELHDPETTNLFSVEEREANVLVQKKLAELSQKVSQSPNQKAGAFAEELSNLTEMLGILQIHPMTLQKQG